MLSRPLIKSFIGKSNETRYESDTCLQDKWDNVELCNQVMIFNELLGYKLFGLACDVPKAYIGIKNNKAVKIYVQKLNGVVDFFHYIDPTQPIDNIINRIKSEDKAIVDIIRSIDKLGILFFIGLWLDDPDTFGKFFSNILFVDNKLLKIDPAEMNLASDNSSFDFFIGRLKKGALENGMWGERYPMIGKVYKWLSQEQVEAALNVFKMLDDAIYESCINWTLNQFKEMEHHLPDTDVMMANLKYRKEKIIQLISHRLEDIVANNNEANNENSVTADTQKQKIPFSFKLGQNVLNDFRQRTVMRDDAHFQQTSEQCQNGNSKPFVYIKLGKSS